MRKKNFLKTSDTGGLEIFIEDMVVNSNHSVMDLRVEAILSLINGIDLKEIEEEGYMYDKYEGYIKRIRKAISENKRRNGT